MEKHATPDPAAQHDEGRMSLMEHFADLRHSLAYGLGGVFLCFVVSLFFFEALSELIIGPLLSALKRLNLEQSVKFRTVQGGFFFHIKIAMLSAFVFGMPILTYQVWRFIAPGLYRDERRLGVALVSTTTLFFAAGVLFGYHLLMPYSFDYLLSYSVQLEGGGSILPDITLEDYTGTFIKIIFASGLVFETPIFIGFLAYAGLVTHHHLIAGWRWATVFSFVIAAVLTPPDYVTQSLLALPLMFFYAISIGVAWYLTERNERALSAALKGEPAQPEQTQESTHARSPQEGEGLQGSRDETSVSPLAVEAEPKSLIHDPTHNPAHDPARESTDASTSVPTDSSVTDTSTADTSTADTSTADTSASQPLLKLEAKPTAHTTSSSSRRVNLNTASAETLQTLPRIGASLAARIIAARAQRPFSSEADLEARVSGLSARMIENMRALITL